MTSKSKSIVETSDEGLLSIPPELITRILCQLPSFTDVFVFAATCHRLRDIWTSSSAAVYTEVAPRCIPCLPRARILLADQGRIDPDSPQVSAKDVVQMVHNAHVVDHATEHFEREIVPSIKGNTSLPPCTTNYPSLPNTYRLQSEVYRTWTSKDGTEKGCTGTHVISHIPREFASLDLTTSSGAS